MRGVEINFCLMRGGYDLVLGHISPISQPPHPPFQVIIAQSLKGKHLKFPAMKKHFGIFGGGLKLQGITKNPPLYLTKKLPSIARNLKINEQSKHSQLPLWRTLEGP